jgi:type III restriction enzyme
MRTWARQLLGSRGNSVIAADAEVTHRLLSEVPKLTMRESASLAVEKSIYLRLPFPTRSGGLERAFIETADRDGSVDAFCKLNEQKAPLSPACAISRKTACRPSITPTFW